MLSHQLVAELLIHGADPVQLSKKIVQLVSTDEDALQQLVHGLETRDAASQLAQLLPHLKVFVIQHLLEFDLFHQLMAKDPKCLSDEFLADFLSVCSRPEPKMFIQYMPAKRAAGLLLHFCPDLATAFHFLADSELPDDVEDAILAEVRAGIHAGDAEATQPPEGLPVASSPAVTVTANAPATDAPPATMLPTPPKRPRKRAPPAAAATHPTTSTHVVTASPADRNASAPGHACCASVKQQPSRACAPLGGLDEESEAQSSSGDYSADSYVPTSPKPSHRAPQLVSPSAQASTTPLRPSAVPARPTTATSTNTTSDEGPETPVYGDVQIRSVEEHRRRWKGKMNQAMWASLQESPGSYRDSDSEPDKWPAIIANYQPNSTHAVDLPPVLDPDTQALHAAREYLPPLVL